MTSAYTLDLWPSRTRIDLVNPNPADYCIEDIAWGLSMECRFANQIPVFYSVAEHCVHAAAIANVLDVAFLPHRCLLHDAAEGVGWRDLPSPVKALIPGYKKYEKIHQRAIYERFNLAREDADLDAQVKAIDNHMYELEHSHLRKGHVLPGLKLQMWAPQVARAKFMEVFHELFGRTA